jgi:hypothetical protein
LRFGFARKVLQKASRLLSQFSHQYRQAGDCLDATRVEIFSDDDAYYACHVVTLGIIGLGGELVSRLKHNAVAYESAKQYRAPFCDGA